MHAPACRRVLQCAHPHPWMDAHAHAHLIGCVGSVRIGDAVYAGVCMVPGGARPRSSSAFNCGRPPKKAPLPCWQLPLPAGPGGTLTGPSPPADPMDCACGAACGGGARPESLRGAEVLRAWAWGGHGTGTPYAEVEGARWLQRQSGAAHTHTQLVM